MSPILTSKKVDFDLFLRGFVAKIICFFAEVVIVFFDALTGVNSAYNRPRLQAIAFVLLPVKFLR